MKQNDLRTLRKLAGLTIAKTSRLTAIDRATLSQIETGGIPASAERIKKIRRTLLRVMEKRSAEIKNALVLFEEEKGQGNK